MFSPKYFNSRFYSPQYWAPAGDYSQARYIQIADLDAARGLPSRSQKINYVEVQAESQNVRYRDDGITPTSAIGMILYAGQAPTRFAGGSIGLIKFIEASSGAKLNIRFY